MSPKTGSTDRGPGVEAVEDARDTAARTIEWVHLDAREHANPVLLAALKATVAAREQALARTGKVLPRLVEDQPSEVRP